MSDKAAVLVYSGYFLACLRPRLIGVKDVKGVEGVDSLSIRYFCWQYPN